MQHKDETFRDTRIDLHGKFFHGCTFERCELVFDGDRPPTFSDNRFVDCVFVLTDAAARTLYLLSTIYKSGAGGREVVDNIIDDIREDRLHGHELRTAVPSTADHSLA
ncbi:MAG TPA: hypothetical protein VLA56_11850 [Pseudomonadales bacterium]|nr:hypothetical protein [Pseudomonadales bacterium]